jgi:hypothetical protein
MVVNLLAIDLPCGYKYFSVLAIISKASPKIFTFAFIGGIDSFSLNFLCDFESLQCITYVFSSSDKIPMTLTSYVQLKERYV